LPSLPTNRAGAKNRVQWLIISGVQVELRPRVGRTRGSARYQVFLASGRYSSGTVWRAGRKWLSTEGPTFGSRKAAIRSLIQLCVRRQRSHLVDAKRASQERVRPFPNAASGNLRPCPVCSVSVRRDRVARHLERVHGHSDGHQDAPKAALHPDSSSRRFVRCPKCGVPVRRLGSHLRRFHNRVTRLVSAPERAECEPPKHQRSKSASLTGSSPVRLSRIATGLLVAAKFFGHRSRSRPRVFQGGRPESNRRRH